MLVCFVVFFAGAIQLSPYIIGVLPLKLPLSETLKMSLYQACTYKRITAFLICKGFLNTSKAYIIERFYIREGPPDVSNFQNFTFMFYQAG